MTAPNEHPSWTAPPPEDITACWCGTRHERMGCPAHCQPRERAVACSRCTRWTWNVAALCDGCWDLIAAPVTCQMSAPDAPHTTSEPSGICLSCSAVLARMELAVRS